jgi:hypothetical protein
MDNKDYGKKLSCNKCYSEINPKGPYASKVHNGATFCTYQCPKVNCQIAPIAFYAEDGFNDFGMLAKRFGKKFDLGTFFGLKKKSSDCECGAGALGIKDHTPGHSQWCPAN